MTKPDVYPLPKIDDCLDSLGDAMIFTTLDPNSGYWKLPVAEEDRDRKKVNNVCWDFQVQTNAMWPEKCSGDFPKSTGHHLVRRMLVELHDIPRRCDYLQQRC